MGSKLFVSLISSFVLTVSVCAMSPIGEDDKKPAKASSTNVKKNENTKIDITQSDDIYISDNMLYIKTPSVNDLIYVYNASGLCIDKFIKDTELVAKDATAYPTGDLIVTNGKDLTVKVIK